MPAADDSSPMRAPARRRSIREQPAKAPLSKEAVIDAALSILKSDGLEAVTMRRVAAALDTGAASLYVYVSGREGLIQGMLDRVTASIEREPADPARWREQLHRVLRRTHRALTAYPGVAMIALANQPMEVTEPQLLLAENMLAIVLAGGIDPQDAAWACDVLMLLVAGAASEDDARRARGYSDDNFLEQVDALYGTFANLPVDRFPMLNAYAAEMVHGDGDERFAFYIDVVIEGVLARARRR